MRNIKPGNNLTVKWTLLHHDGTPFHLVDYEYRLFYSTGRGKREETRSGTIGVDGNVLTWVFAGERQTSEGEYDLQLKILSEGELIATLYKSEVFCLSENGVENTSPEIFITSYV